MKTQCCSGTAGPLRGSLTRSLRSLALAGALWAALVSDVIAQPSASPSARPSASQTVDRFQRTLIEVMRSADALGFQGRAIRFAALVDEVFDFARISRRIVGPEWGALRSEQKDLLRDALERLAVAMLASQFNEFSGEKFLALKEMATRGSAGRVATKLVLGDSEQITVIYILRDGPRGWRIEDVQFDGVSEVEIRRAEVRSILRRRGFDVLVSNLDGRARALAAGTK